MKKRFPFFFGYVLSLFLPVFYDDVAKHWKGAALGYSALLAFVVWLITAFTFFPQMTSVRDSAFSHFEDQLPTITYQDGVLSTPSSKPYRIDVDGQPLLLIDTANKVDEKERQLYPMVVTDKEFISYQNGVANEQNLVELLQQEGMEEGTLEPSQIIGFLKQGTDTLYYIAMPFYLIFIWVRMLLEALVLSLIALMMNTLLRKALDYPALYRLCVVSLTPGYVISTVCVAAWVYAPRFPQIMWLLYGLTVLYTMFAVASVRRIPEPEPPADAIAPMG